MFYTIIINIASYILADYIGSVIKKKKEDYYKVQLDSIELDEFLKEDD